MSPIGKIFIVVNLALSAAFLGWASNIVATSQDFKKQRDELEVASVSEKKTLEDELAKARTELNAVRQDKQVLADERDDQKSRADRAENDRNQLASENAQLRNDLTRIGSSLDDYNKQLEAFKTSAQRDTDARLAAERERNDAVQAQRDAEIALRDAQGAASAAEARTAELGGEVDAAKASIASLEALRDTMVAKYNISLPEVWAQPDIDGAVTSVKTDLAPGLVAINKGSDHGVRRGTTFEIFNGQTYKGQVRVELVHPTWCSAIIVRTANGPMSQGDSAATNL